MKWKQLRFFRKQKSVTKAILWVSVFPVVVRIAESFKFDDKLPSGLFTLYFGGIFFFLASILIDVRFPDYLKHEVRRNIIFPQDRNATIFINLLSKSLDKDRMKDLWRGNSELASLILKHLAYATKSGENFLSAKDLERIFRRRDLENLKFSVNKSINRIDFETEEYLDDSRKLSRIAASILLICGLGLIAMSVSSNIQLVFKEWFNISK